MFVRKQDLDPHLHPTIPMNFNLRTRCLDEMQYKSAQVPEFVDKMKGLMEEQRLEIERAVVGTGEYRLRKEYHYLTVESSVWFKMTTEQRKRKIDKFMKAPLQKVFNRPENSNCPLDSLSLPPQLVASMWEKAKEHHPWSQSGIQV